MRKIKNHLVTSYLAKRTKFEGEHLEVLTSVVSLTAYYGEILPYDELAYFVGTNTDILSDRLEQTVDLMWKQDTFKFMHDWMNWTKKPSARRLIYVLATEVLQVGYSPEAPESEEAHATRDVLDQLFVPSLIHRGKQFRGYLILREYLCDLMVGFDMDPGKWLDTRYGKGSSAKADLGAFVTLLWDNPKAAIERGVFNYTKSKPQTCAFMRDLRIWLNDKFEEIVA